MSLSAYLNLGLLGFLLVGSYLEGAQIKSCPRNWLRYNGHCYGYFSQELSWPMAEGRCQRTGGHLASILDEDEHKAVAKFLLQAQKQDDEEVWIGLFIPAKSRSWRWVDNSPVSYTAWEKYESYYALEGEHCAVLDDDSEFSLWDNDSCNDRNPFLCKV